MAFVVKFVKTVRNHWKKSIFFSAVSIYGIKYAKTKYDEDLMRREYCAEARKYGMETIAMGQRPRRITVFLNPAAHFGKGSKLFEKNAAPMLYLAGIEVNVVKTEYDGQVKKFLSVLENTETDAVVVAGGDGTLLEAVTGIMRKENKKFRQTVPVGVIPIGITNRFAQFVFGTDLDTVRIIAESAMAVIRGVTKKVDVLKVKGEDGRTSYALSGLEMGAFRDAEERKSKYWYFGPLKSRWTYIRTAMKKWPPVVKGNINYLLATEDEDSAVKTKKKNVEKKSSWSWLNIFYRPKVITEALDEEDGDDEEDDNEAGMMSEQLSAVEFTVITKEVFMSQHRFGSKSRKSEVYLKGTNPLNRFGKRSRCMICQSVFHWAKDCPDKAHDTKYTQDVTEEVDDCNLTLFTKSEQTAAEIFVMESFGTAVIDTACTRTVCGERWFDNFVEENKNKKIYKSDSHRAFKFGDGQKIYSFKRAIIPATIGETPCNIDTEIVKADIPLLLSKNSLKKAGTVLDLKNDQAVMFEQPIMLQLTSSGHYCVDITGRDNFIPEETEQEVLVIEGDLSETEKWRILKKLHKQFGHASAERLTKLLKSAGTTDKSTLAMLQNITHDCEICAKLKKPTPRPVVGLPLATEYNETIAVDLHELENGRVWYLHIIDEFTRFSAGCIVRTKCSSEFVKKFMEIWICVHGAPKRLYSDNGGEFNSNEVRDMCENFNIENKTTPGYSPWSNGLLERHNMVLTEILLKVKEENSCDWSTALHWSLMAKNSLNNVHGYSPYQLVFGCTPNLPSVLVDKPPALEGTTISQTVGEHIIALHAARTAFTQSECSERIRRALRKQTRNCGEHFDMRDKVFYKRPDSQEWKGPGVVIGQDGAVVFIRHGGTLVRVHRCRLSKVHPKVETNSDNLENRLQESTFSLRPQKLRNGEDDKGGHCDDSSEEENTGNTQDVEAEDHVEQRNVSLRKGQIVRYKNTDTGVECVKQRVLSWNHETLALADAIDTGLFLTTLHSELTGGNTKATTIPIVCLTDNHSLYEAVKSTKSVADKRLRIELSSIKELISKKKVKGIRWLSTKCMLADCLTKKRASPLELLKVVSEGVWRDSSQA
ncbi:hypothetical protein ScPMuIL_010292 [Solemya velum]